MYEKQSDGFYYEVRDGMCVGRPKTAQEIHDEQAMSNDLLVRGVTYYRAQGRTWHTAGEQAAEGAITYLGLDPASTDAFNLRASFAAVARGLAAAERGL